MDIATDRQRSRRRLIIVIVAAVAVVLLGAGLAIERLAGYTITGQRLTAEGSGTDSGLAGAPPDPRSSSALRASSAQQASSQPTPSLTPIPGVTVASVLAKLPASWGITRFGAINGSPYVFAATTSKAVSGTQLEATIGVSTANGDQVKAFNCQFSRTPISVDTILVAAAKTCVNAVMPAADQQAAAAWVDANLAVTLNEPKVESLHGVRLSLRRTSNTFGVLIGSNAP